MSGKTEKVRSEADLARYLAAYPEEIAFGDEPAETVFDRYHTLDYVVVSDGIPLDRQRVIDHAAPARKRVRSVTVDVQDALLSGDRVAARFVLTAEMRKGNQIVTEVHMFGRLSDDGRLRHAEQLTRSPQR